MIESLKIGILGGGQLGKMLVQAALDLDLDIHILDPDSSAPCRNICSSFTVGDLNDYQTVLNFASKLDVITIEIENVNIEALKELEKQGKKVYPQPHIVENIKNKISQKQFYTANNIPTADFRVVNNRAEIENCVDYLPFVNKIATGGYDGKGVQMVKNQADISKSFDAHGIIEKLVNFKKELAVIVARSENGEIKTFPVVEMAFHPEANLVEYLFAPAHVSDQISNKAQQLAIKVAKIYGIVGLLAVEMFLDQEDNILVNEVAPRPHNSGHHTLRANYCSQFDQHWRAILGLPLQETTTICQAAMVNIVGAENATGNVKIVGLTEVLSQENIFPYFYGKKTTKPFRKMGHVSILENNFETLKEKINFVQRNLIITAQD